MVESVPMSKSSRAAEVVLALDIGTGGVRVNAYTLAGMLVATSETKYPTYYERPAWAEQEPEDWWQATMLALREIATHLDHSSPGYHIHTIGLTGQSPSIAPFDHTGKALRRSLIYQDNRAMHEAQELVARLGEREAVHQRTGHDPAAFYIGPKLLWLQKYEPEVFAATHLWMQPRDFVVWRLTGIPATDWSHAGSTLLFDITTRSWDDDLFERLAIPRTSFPPALAPWTIVGEMRPAVAKEVGLSPHIPVVLGGADSQCCVVGAGILHPGVLSDMAGTSTCLNMATRPPLSDLRIANYCHVVPDWWCTELGLNASGAAFAWLATQLAPPGAAPIFAECERAASLAEPGASGLIFLPYLADGERTNPGLRGGFCGLSLRHGRSDLARAVFEGVAFAIREYVDIMAEAGASVREIHVSGGGARVQLWNQIKADVIGVPVVSVSSDATSLGVAIVAATAVGAYSSLEQAVATSVKMTHRCEPTHEIADLYAERYARFRMLAQATAEPMEGHK
nr:FGGY family carbohydrate kinase [Ktedonobacteraceae bacterium]